MHITDYLGIPKGHSYIDFVDVTTDSDTQLFIDPCLIERGKDQLSRRAAALISSYADQLYKDMRSGQWKSTAVFDEAHEIHDTKLGYGNGRNGKGKTSHGMQESLDGLYRLANDIPSISKIQDISLLVEDFAEDCILFFKEHIHAQRFQLPHRFQQRHRIAGKTAETFDDDHVDLAVFAVRQQPLEVLSLLRCAGHFIRINASKNPIRIALNQIAEVADLRGEGVQHRILYAGNPRIGGNALFPGFLSAARHGLINDFCHSAHLLGSWHVTSEARTKQVKLYQQRAEKIG